MSKTFCAPLRDTAEDLLRSSSAGRKEPTFVTGGEVRVESRREQIRRRITQKSRHEPQHASQRVNQAADLRA